MQCFREQTNTVAFPKYFYFSEWHHKFPRSIEVKTLGLSLTLLSPWPPMSAVTEWYIRKRKGRSVKDVSFIHLGLSCGVVPLFLILFQSAPWLCWCVCCYHLKDVCALLEPSICDSGGHPIGNSRVCQWLCNPRPQVLLTARLNPALDVWEE